MIQRPLHASASLFAATLAVSLLATGCGKKKNEVPVKETDKAKAEQSTEAMPKESVATPKPEEKPAPKSETKAPAKPEAKPAPTQASSEFDKTLSLEGIEFRVQCPNAGSLNDLTIIPKGLEIDNKPAKIKDIDGSVVGAEVADLNNDGSPEIYIYVQSAGSGSYGTLIAYSVNNKKSMTPIYVPDLDDKLSKGYMGHDEFAIVEGTLARRFPIYKEGDANAKPTGGTRQISYKLKNGEATWLLEVEKVNEY